MGIKKELPVTIGQKATVGILGEQYDVYIRGWETWRHIITDFPLSRAENFRVIPGTGCTLSFVNAGEFVSFETSVIHFLFQTVALLVIGYPKIFELHDLRTNKRFQTNFPLKYSFENAGSTVVEGGTIRDIGLGGLLFTHANPLTKESKIFIQAELPGGVLTHQEAVVRNLRKNPKSEKEPYVTGVQLVNVSEENVEILMKFIESRAMDRRISSRT